MSDKNYRTETDPLGEKKVPIDAYYGIHTQRAYENFQISGYGAPLSLVHALAVIKVAAAGVHKKLGLLEKKKADVMIIAGKELIAGLFDDDIILDIFQAGAGTATHMNINEIIANRANELLGEKKGTYVSIHPNNDVNMGQSTNDVFPAAIHIAVLHEMNNLLPHLKTCAHQFMILGKKYAHIKKSGRTHLQDAVPITLGKEFEAYGETLYHHYQILKKNRELLYGLHLGGTAIGTGVNCHPQFGKEVINQIAKQIKFPLYEVQNKIEATQNRTPLTQFSSFLRSLAIDLNRIGNDLRLLASGPHTGLAEISLPAVEPGSSIMPGKVNPSIIECLHMICYRIIGNDSTLTQCAQAGQLELNVMMPLMAHCLLESVDLLSNGIKMFTERCLLGLKVNEHQCTVYFEETLGLATYLNPFIGYDRAAKLAQDAVKHHSTIRNELIKQKIFSKKEVDELFSTEVLLNPQKGKKIKKILKKKKKK